MAPLPQDLLMSFRFAAAMIRDENKESALAAHRMVEWAENELSVIGLNARLRLRREILRGCSFMKWLANRRNVSQVLELRSSKFQGNTKVELTLL
jgi:hypothetical protein